MNLEKAFKPLLGVSALILSLALGYHYAFYIPQRDNERAIQQQKEQEQKAEVAAKKLEKAYDIDVTCPTDYFGEQDYAGEGLTALTCIKSVDPSVSMKMTDAELSEQLRAYFVIRCRMETTKQVLNTRLCTTFDQETVRVTITD